MLMKHGSVITQQDPMTASTLLGAPPTSECLIKPVSGQAKLTRNCLKTPLKISDGPRLHLDVQLDTIPVSLSDTQYESIVRVLESFHLRIQARKFQRWRPLVGVAGNAREWWGFAIATARQKIRQRNKSLSKHFALLRARQNVVYVTAYAQHLSQEAWSEETKDEMKLIETELSYEQLAVLRKIAMARVKKQRGLAEVRYMHLYDLSSIGLSVRMYLNVCIICNVFYSCICILLWCIVYSIVYCNNSVCAGRHYVYYTNTICDQRTLNSHSLSNSCPLRYYHFSTKGCI